MILKVRKKMGFKKLKLNYSSLINEYLSTTFIKNAYESKDNEKIQ